MRIKDLIPGEEYKVRLRFTAVPSVRGGHGLVPSLAWPAVRTVTRMTFDRVEEKKAVFHKDEMVYDFEDIDPHVWADHFIHGKKKVKTVQKEYRFTARDVVGPATKETAA